MYVNSVNFPDLGKWPHFDKLSDTYVQIPLYIYHFTLYSCGGFDKLATIFFLVEQSMTDRDFLPICLQAIFFIQIPNFQIGG